MKSTKVTELPQSGEGTMHEVPRLRTKVRGPDKGADKPRPLEDIYSLGIRGRAPGTAVRVLALWPAQPYSLLACSPTALEHYLSFKYFQIEAKQKK